MPEPRPTRVRTGLRAARPAEPAPRPRDTFGLPRERALRMPKHRLDDAAALPDAVVFGISCHVPDYRLCWSLNRALGLELERRRSDIVEHARGKELHYTVFDQRDEESEVRWSLVSNTCGKRRLIPSQRSADFFLVVDPEVAEAQDGLLGRIRGAEFVLTAFALPMNELRMGHKLLL